MVLVRGRDAPVRAGRHLFRHVHRSRCYNAGRHRRGFHKYKYSVRGSTPLVSRAVAPRYEPHHSATTETGAAPDGAAPVVWLLPSYAAAWNSALSRVVLSFWGFVFKLCEDTKLEKRMACAHTASIFARA